MLWYTREASVAVYVSNLPMIWPLLREWFPSLRALTPGQKSSGPSGKRVYGANGSVQVRRDMGKPRKLSSAKGEGDSTEELSSSGVTELGTISRKKSWENERIGVAKGGGSWETETMKGGIHLSTVVKISEEHVGKINVVRPHPAVMERDLEKMHHQQPGFKWV